MKLLKGLVAVFGYIFMYLFGLGLAWYIVDLLYGGHNSINTSSLSGESQGILSMLFGVFVLGPSFAIGYRKLLERYHFYF